MVELDNKSESEKKVLPEDVGGYELSFILNNQTAASAVSTLLNKYGAEIQLYNEPKPIKLAYTINSKTSGFFGFYNFLLKKESVANLQHDLRLTSDVLRFLIVKLKSGKITRNKSVYQSPISDKVQAPESRSASGSLTNEALEAKIQEMLK